MKRSEAKRIVGENIEWLRWSMNLQDWKIKVFYRELGDGDDKARTVTLGQCSANVYYRWADIFINHKAHDSEEQLLDTLRHELFHVLHSEFDVYIDQVSELVSDETKPTLRISHKLAIERLVGNLERMIDFGLGLSPAKMVAAAKEHVSAGHNSRTNSPTASVTNGDSPPA
jgi:hypothetical protein